MDPFMLIIVAVVFLLIIAVVSLFLYFRGQGADKSNKPTSGDAETPAPPPIAERITEPPPAPKPTPAPPIAPPEILPPALLAVRRDPFGEWDIRIQGEPYPRLEYVADDAVRQEVVQAIRALATFSRDYIQQHKGVAAPPAKSAPPPAPVATPPPVLPADMGIHTPVTSATMPTFVDIAREIQAVVEQLQRQVPQLAAHRIQLRNAPTGGVLFVVDNTTYNDLDEIPNATVRKLIQAAIKEWERR